MERLAGVEAGHREPEKCAPKRGDHLQFLSGIRQGVGDCLIASSYFAALQEWTAWQAKSADEVAKQSGSPTIQPHLQMLVDASRAACNLATNFYFADFAGAEILDIDNKQGYRTLVHMFRARVSLFLTSSIGVAFDAVITDCFAWRTDKAMKLEVANGATDMAGMLFQRAKKHQVLGRGHRAHHCGPEER